MAGKEMTAQQIKDQMDSNTAVIGGLLHEAQYHQGILVNIEKNIAQRREHNGELAKLLKPPELKDDTSKTS